MDPKRRPRYVFHHHKDITPSFHPDVGEGCTVNELRIQIVAECLPRFKRDASDLILYKLLQPPPFEPEDELNDLVLNGEKELLNNPVQTLAELFPSPDTSRVYIYAILQDVQPPGLIDRELEHLRKHLAVKLPGLRTERIGEDALAANDIQYKSVDTLPDALAGADKEEALDFFHQLNRKIPVFKTHGRGHQNHPILPYHLIRILRVCLGDRFDDHFEELIGPQPGDVASSAKLASFVTAATRHSEKEHQFTGNFSALAKEACLTAVVIDPALDRFGTPYNRGDDACDIVVEDEKQRFFKWTPRNGFQLRYQLRGVRFGLVHGEVESKGETEATAMHKMAVMALHSHKVMQYLTNRSRIIFCSYISEAMCTMYLFYKQLPTPQSSTYVMQQILQSPEAFRPEYASNAVGILRRIYNLSYVIEDGQPETTPEKGTMIANLTLGLSSVRSVKATTNKRRRTESDHGGNPSEPPPADLQVLQTAFYSMKSMGRPYLYYVKKRADSPTLCTKWTCDTAEVKILNRLRSARNPQHLHHNNHIIPVIEVIQCPSGASWIVMPVCNPLTSLISLAPAEYCALRGQLVQAVAFLHSHDLAHCDIKPENIVVQSNSRPYGELYLIDFGNATTCRPGTYNTGFQGTKGWTAPEVHENGRWEPKAADVWAMGNVLRSLGGLVGFHDALIQDCLAEDPGRRPSAQAVSDTLVHQSINRKRLRTDSGIGLESDDEFEENLAKGKEGSKMSL
ncbi:hypothetical protein FRB94_003503 [Tulasnella sp. JGI-2019a]|nr:hypothetical protein FRB94_003503 [Tulasnella sp. JGI-2019a]